MESNDAFFHNLVENYVDIVFANETEAKAFTKLEPREACDEIARHCRIAVVKVGKAGSMVQSGDEYHFIDPWPATPVDATGAGDTYAAGFLYAHSLGMPLRVCGEVGSIIAAKVVEVIGTKIDIPRWRDAKQEVRVAAPGDDVVPFGVLAGFAVAVAVAFGGSKTEGCHFGIALRALGIGIKVTDFRVISNVTDQHDFVECDNTVIFTPLS